MASFAGSSSDDFIIATVNGGEYRGGAGNDTYIFTPLIPANAVITIVDNEGANKVQLAEGLTIASSSFFDNAAQLTLSNGAVLKILGAKNFTFDIGANAVAGDSTVAPGTTVVATYAQFAASLGVAILPAAGSTTPASGTANYSTMNGNGGGNTPTFSVTGATAVAEGASATFTVTLNASQTTSKTVAYTLTGSGGAIMGTDAGSSTPSQNSGTLTFAAGETTKSVTVPILTDQVTPETGEGVTITLSSPSTGTALAVATATTAITDVPPSLYSLVANVPTVLEGAAAVFTATRTGDISAAKTLTFTTVGDSSSTGAAATVGVDYTPSSGALTFAAGSNTATFSVNVVNDNTFESIEGLKVSLFDGNTSVGTSTMLLIADAATYAIVAASPNVDEGGTAKFNVTTNVADGTVGYTISGTGITAADTTDGKLTGTATITSGVATISVPLSLDNITEGTEILRVTIADGITSATIAVNDTSLNKAPFFVSSTTAFSVAENSTAVTTATATDATALTYSISGTDAAKFSVDSATGAIAFKTAPNFEVDAKSYAVTVTASDGSLSASKNLTVTVTDVNEAPTFAAATSAASYAENGTAAVGTYTATDVDAGDTLTYSVGGADTALFSVSSTGALSFKATPNFEAPASSKGTNVYDVNVVATDKGGLTASRAVTVTVTDVNENTSATYAIAAGAASYNEGTTAIFTVNTTNVANGTVLNYTLSGTGITPADITGGALAGTITINNNIGTISVPLALDATTEGNETLNVTVNGKTASTTIVDTSVASSFLNVDLSTGNVAGAANAEAFVYDYKMVNGRVTKAGDGLVTITGFDPAKDKLVFNDVGTGTVYTKEQFIVLPGVAFSDNPFTGEASIILDPDAGVLGGVTLTGVTTSSIAIETLA